MELSFGQFHSLFRSFKYWITLQGSIECNRMRLRWTENGERFSKNGERFRQNGERFSASRHPLADIRASVGRQRGRRRARASARENSKISLHLSHTIVISLCTKGFGAVTRHRSTCTRFHRAFTPPPKGGESISVFSTLSHL